MLLSSLYQEKLSQYQGQLGGIQNKINFVAVLRMIFFLGFAICFYFFASRIQYAFLYSGSGSLIAFVVLVRLSLGLKEKRTLLEKLLFINSNELDILQARPNRFSDKPFFRNEYGAMDDLDIFGPQSLFHLLNRTTTSHGSKQLAKFLTVPLQEISIIKEYQQSVQELSGQIDQRQLLTAYGLIHEEKEMETDSVKDWIKTPIQLRKSQGLIVVRWTFPLLNLLGIFYYFTTGNYIPFFIGIILSWGTTRIHRRYIAEQYQLISKKHPILDQYASILESFAGVESRSSNQLNRLKSTALEAHKAIRRLSRISSFFDQRLGILAGFIYNALFMHDLQCLFELEKWKQTSQNEFESWMDCIGNIEYLCSLGGFAFNHPSYCYPVFRIDHLCIEAVGLAHPLIQEKERVANDFSIGRNEKLQLITGSNMSGKTTFLRTLGVNLLLGQIGAPVCASSFTAMPMQILSSLRINDSLQEHTSYFMAELKKLQQIILQLKNGLPALVLIDEILRGTNSEDKTFGSEQFIHTLLRYNCLTLFATHDLSLSQLEFSYPAVVSNYRFESKIVNGQLYFDYKLQKGVANNKNASFLMKQMGLL